MQLIVLAALHLWWRLSWRIALWAAAGGALTIAGIGMEFRPGYAVAGQLMLECGVLSLLLGLAGLPWMFRRVLFAKPFAFDGAIWRMQVSRAKAVHTGAVLPWRECFALLGGWLWRWLALSLPLFAGFAHLLFDPYGGSVPHRALLQYLALAQLCGLVAAWWLLRWPGRGARIEVQCQAVRGAAAGAAQAAQPAPAAHGLRRSWPTALMLALLGLAVLVVGADLPVELRQSAVGACVDGVDTAFFLRQAGPPTARALRLCAGLVDRIPARARQRYQVLRDRWHLRHGPDAAALRDLELRAAAETDGLDLRWMLHDLLQAGAASSASRIADAWWRSLPATTSYVDLRVAANLRAHADANLGRWGAAAGAERDLLARVPDSGMIAVNQARERRRLQQVIAELGQHRIPRQIRAF